MSGRAKHRQETNEGPPVIPWLCMPSAHLGDWGAMMCLKGRLVWLPQSCNDHVSLTIWHSCTIARIPGRIWLLLRPRSTLMYQIYVTRVFSERRRNAFFLSQALPAAAADRLEPTNQHHQVRAVNISQRLDGAIRFKPYYFLRRIVGILVAVGHLCEARAKAV